MPSPFTSDYGTLLKDTISSIVGLNSIPIARRNIELTGVHRSLSLFAIHSSSRPLDFRIMSPSPSPPAVPKRQVGRVFSLLALLTVLIGCGVIFNVRSDRLNRQLSLDEYIAATAAQRAKLALAGNETSRFRASVDAETMARIRKNFLGGAYPEVDERHMPLHLRNVVRDKVSRFHLDFARSFRARSHTFLTNF